MCDRTVTSRDAIVSAALRRSWSSAGAAMVNSTACPPTLDKSHCVWTAPPQPMPPGDHLPQPPCSARYHQTARVGLPLGIDPAGSGPIPSTRPRLAGANGIRYAGAAHAADNPEFGARFTTGGKGNIGGNIESGQKRPGARARQGCGNETVAVRRQAVSAACTPGSRIFGLPTVTATARRQPGRPAWPGPGLLTRDGSPDDNTHLMKLVSCT